MGILKSLIDIRQERSPHIVGIDRGGSFLDHVCRVMVDAKVSVVKY